MSSATNADTSEAPDGELADEEMVAVEAHPRAIRWMHWLNFPIISIMVWSGLRIYWSFDFTRVVGEFGDNNLIPNDFYETLQLDRKLARGLSFHFSFGWLFVINGLFYVGYLILSREGRHIVPKPSDLKNIVGTMLHDVGLRKEAPPHGPVQRDPTDCLHHGVDHGIHHRRHRLCHLQANAACLAYQPVRGL